MPRRGQTLKPKLQWTEQTHTHTYTRQCADMLPLLYIVIYYYSISLSLYIYIYYILYTIYYTATTIVLFYIADPRSMYLDWFANRCDPQNGKSPYKPPNAKGAKCANENSTFTILNCLNELSRLPPHLKRPPTFYCLT